MAKEITTSINATIAPKAGGKAAGTVNTTEDLAGQFYGFSVTAGTAASAINIGVPTPKLVFIQNTDPVSTLTVDNVITMNGWPQAIPPGAGVLLRPPNGTLFGKTNIGPAAVWVVAG